MVVASYERSGAAFRAPQLSSVSIPPCSGRGPILRPPSPERRGGQGVRSYRGVGVLGPRRRPRAAAAPATSAPATAMKSPGPRRGTSIGFAPRRRYVMSSCTISQAPNPADAPPSSATAQRTPEAGRSHPRMPATRQTAPPAARTRPFNPITPRSGCSPANSVSHGRNAPVAIIAPPATAARAKRRPSLGSRLARAHIEEQVDVGQDLRRDLRAGRIGGLEADRGDDMEDRNVAEPGVAGPVRAALARGGRADRVPVLHRRPAEERFVIEELDRLPLQPTRREPELGVIHLILGLLERR